MTPNNDESPRPAKAGAEAEDSSPTTPDSTPTESSSGESETAPAAESAPPPEAAAPIEAEAKSDGEATPDAEAAPAADEKPAVEIPVELPVEAPAEAPKEAVEIAAAEVEAEAPSTEMTSESATLPEAVEVESGSSASAEKESAGEADSSEAREEMAKALEATVVPSLKAGKRVKVKLVQLGEKESFVDWGGPSEGAIATSELKNKEGELLHKEGEEFTATVKKSGDQVLFTLGRKAPPPHITALKKAYEDAVPVQGNIRAVNKGGFDVNLGGARAFCPFSQIQLGYCDKPEQYVGQDLSFMVITFERGGRNIVVSRRKILEEESKGKAELTRENLQIGAVFPGVVRRIQPYGAFIDVGGLDGLVHVSEIRHGRVGNPADILEVGQEVEVKIIKIEGLGSDKERISLSMKDLVADPWDQVAENLKLGENAMGKVVRLTEFGAFVELLPGVDGLIHISEISNERIGHPSELLTPGQEVEVRVLNIDFDQQRISLSLKAADAPEGEYSAEPTQAPRSQPAFPKKKEPEVDPFEGMSYEEKLEALKRKFQGA